MDLDFYFFSRLNGISVVIGPSFYSSLEKLRSSLVNGEVITTTDNNPPDELVAKLKKVKLNCEEIMGDLRSAAATVQSIYQEVTKTEINAVPGSDNGRGGPVLMIK